jgi:hypothetical protein
MAVMASALPSEVRKNLSHYDVVYNTMSTTGSMMSMPIGTGDITANVWVERGGDLMMYIGKSDSWAESSRLLKIGRLRISLSPNPFVSGATFHETLNLIDGEISIVAGSTKIRVWGDAMSPVIRVVIESKSGVKAKCVSELMRPVPYTLPSAKDALSESFHGFIKGNKMPSESADKFISKKNSIEWYHRNETSPFPMMLKLQNVPQLANKYQDPCLHRTFGAAVTGNDMQVLNDSSLVSADNAKKISLNVYALTSITETVNEWDSQLSDIISSDISKSFESLYNSHKAWWEQFWNRSWIFITGDKDAETLTRSYILQRYQMAIQSRGAYPVKFNGGSLTFDYEGLNGDYRRWGGGYWHQNTRQMYWPLAESGDFDLKKPLLEMYMHNLPLQTDICKSYYGHEGAFFPETTNFFGMYIQDDWGWDNPGKASDNRYIRYHYQGALEVLCDMLDMYGYTNDESFARQNIIPFATQVIRFFDRHWPRINHTLRFIPANAIEEYWDCLNPADYISGLTHDITRLKALPKDLVSQQLLDEWDNCLKSLPSLPMKDGKLMPAEEYGSKRNVENPELYSVFPYRLYGVGLPNIDVAKRTFDSRIYKLPHCWSQDAEQAALLGMTDSCTKYIMKEATSLNPDVAFPGFWKYSADYIPDFDNGGAMATALQFMCLQSLDNKIFLLPAFPKKWSVDFKLRAYNNTIVHVKTNKGQIISSDILPKQRALDVVKPE